MHTIRQLLDHARRTEQVNQEVLGHVIESIIDIETRLGRNVDDERSEDELPGDLGSIASILAAYSRLAPKDALLTEQDFDNITVMLYSFGL